MSSKYVSEAHVARLAVALVERASLMLSEHLSILAQERGAIESVEPNWLVHYTSDQVCRLILESQDVFLFDATTSNDRSEQLHGIEMLWRVLDQAWEFSLEEVEAMCSTIQDPTEISLHRIHRIGRLLRRHIGHGPIVHGLALCLSAPFLDCSPSIAAFSDNLTMWREYGADGAGAAIVFAANDLHFRVQGTRTGLFSVIYDDGQKDTIARYLVVAIAELLADCHVRSWTKYIANENRSLTRREIFYAAGVAVSLLSFLFKDACFSYERETRLIHLAIDSNSLEVFSRGTGKTSRDRYYMPLSRVLEKPGRLPIAAVHLGPRAIHSSDQERIVEICQSRRIPIDTSNLPYRGQDAPISTVAERIRDLRVRDEQIAAALRMENPRALETKLKLKNRISEHWDKLEKLAKSKSKSKRKRGGSAI